MKGAIACFMHVMELLVEHHYTPNGDVVFTAVIDEEKSNMGVNKLLESGFSPDYCIVGEATELNIAIGHRGVVAFDIEVNGVACHAAMTAQGQGVNAIELGAKVVNQIQDVDQSLKTARSELLGFSQFNVTGFQSGIKVNVIPDVAYLQVDGRTAMSETLEDMKGLLQERLGSMQAAGEIQGFTIRETTFCPSYEISADDVLVVTMQKAAQLVEQQAKTCAFGATCEASLIANTGSKVVVCGPGSLKQAHNANEFVAVDQLTKAAQLYLATVINI